MKNLILLLFSTFVMYSQSYTTVGVVNSLTNNDLSSSTRLTSGMWVVNKPVDNSISGSVYLMSTWDGEFIIQSRNGSRSLLKNLNYNIKEKSLETKFTKDSVFQFNTRDLNYVYINNIKKYKVLNSELLEVLYSGDKIMFLKSFTIYVKEGSTNPLTQQALTPKEYVKKTNSVLYFNEVLQDVKLNKKSILKLLKDKEKAIVDFVKKNDLSYKDENDQIKIFEFYELK